MKKLSLLLLLLLSITGYTHAQSEAEKKQFREKVWDAGNAAFQVVDAPEEWQSESVVLLAKKVDYELDKQSFLAVMNEKISVRNRIKIMDNDGVKAYSELEFEVPRSDYAQFNNYQSEFFFGAKIIKPDGKEVLLNEKDLVYLEVKDEQTKYEKYKIAIPELEAKDIIDYYFGVEIPRMVSRSFESNSFDFLLAGKYPSLHQEYNIILNKKCYLNADSYNGAPDFQLMDKERNLLHYRLVDGRREKYKTERWTYDAEVLPFIKFKVFYIRKERDIPFGSFPNMSAKIDKPIAKWEFQEFINDLTWSTPMGWRIASRFFLSTSSFEHIDVRKTQRYLRKNYKKESDPLKKAEAAYYFLRNNDLAYLYEYNLLYDKSKGYRVNDRHFTKIFSRVLEKNKIDHEVILCVPESTGLDIASAIHSNDVRLLIAVKGRSNQKVYFDSYTRYTNPGELDAWLEGVPAYAVRMVKKKKRRRVEEVSLPVSSYNENKEEEVASVRLVLDGESRLLIDRLTTVSGHRKRYYQNQLVVGYNFIDNSKSRNLESIEVEKHHLLSRKDRKALPQKKINVREESDENIRENYLAAVKSDFSTENVEVEELELKKAGIWNNAPELAYSEKLVVKDLIQRAGPNYLLEIGKLIGGQIALEEEEMERERDVRMDYARMFVNTIELELPEGYIAEGLDKFNFQVENSSGAFLSKARLEGNKVLITSQKIYKKEKVEKEKWNEVVEFLEAAYSFSQQKLLVKKALYGAR